MGLLLVALSWAEASAQSACDPVILNRAESAYEMGWFNRAFDLLKPCVPAGFPVRSERISAYRLLALSYIATDSLEHARAWVRRIVELDRRHATDPQTDPPLFVDYVNDLRPRWYTWLWRGGAWYKWAGRGLIVAGAVALPVVLRSDPEPDLPAPPGFPD